MTRDSVREVLARDLDLAGTVAALGLNLRARPTAGRLSVMSGTRRVLTSVTAYEIWDWLRAIGGLDRCDGCGRTCGSCCDRCGWVRP